MTFPNASHYPPQNSNTCSFNSLRHFKNVYDDDDELMLGFLGGHDAVSYSADWWVLLCVL